MPFSGSSENHGILAIQRTRVGAATCTGPQRSLDAPAVEATQIWHLERLEIPRGLDR